MSTLIHLFLDLENVQPTAAQLELVRGPQFRLWVLHGPQQKYFTPDRVKAWQPLGDQVRFVRSMKAGKNALDLHISFCIGEASEQDRAGKSQACYVIVSGDKDFDALFGYLGSQDILIGRGDSLPAAIRIAAELMAKTAVQPTRVVAKPKAEAKLKATSVSANTQRVLKDLREHPRTRPTTAKRLKNYIMSLLGNGVTEQDVSRVLAELKALAAVTMEGTKVKYGQLGK
jgi:PIN domain